MTNDGRELGEELRELSMDLAPDGPGAVLLLGGSNPAGHDVVGINLRSKAMESISKEKQTVPMTQYLCSLLRSVQHTSADMKHRRHVSPRSHQPEFSLPRV